MTGASDPAARAGRAVAVAAAVGAVLVVSVRFDGVFSAPKLVWTAVLAALGCWCVFVGALRGGGGGAGPAGGRAPLDGPLAALSAAALLSAYFSVDRPLSVLGHQGFYTYGLLAGAVSAGLYFTASRSGLAEAPLGLLRAVAYSAAAAAGLGLLQKAGVSPLAALGTELPLGRIYSTMGNPVYLGAVLALAAPVCARLAFSGDRKDAVPGAVALAAVTAGLLFTQSRAAWLGAAGGLLVWALGARVFSADGLSRRAALGAAVLAALLAFSVWSRDSRRADSARLAMWKSALAIGLAHPAAGVGPDAFENAFRAVRGEGFVRVMGPTAGQASAHNDLLQVFATLGLPGLAAYAACLVVLLRLAGTALADPGRRRDAAAACGALAALFIHAKFDPTPLAALALAALLLGLLSPPASAAGAASGARAPAAVPLALALVCSAAAWESGRLAWADRWFLRARVSRGVGRADLAGPAFARATELNPYETRFRMEHVRFLLDAAGRSTDPSETLALAEAARTVSAQGVVSRPGNVDSWQTHGVLLATLAKAGTPALWAPAAAALERALELDPWFPPLLEQARFVAEARGDAAAAAALRARRERVAELSPR